MPSANCRCSLRIGRSPRSPCSPRSPPAVAQATFAGRSRPGLAHFTGGENSRSFDARKKWAKALSSDRVEWCAMLPAALIVLADTRGAASALHGFDERDAPEIPE